MKNIWTIFKKEWDRVIKDRRLVISVMLLPGFMIFLIYSFIGTALQNSQTLTIYDITIINNQTEFRSIYQTNTDINLNITQGDSDNIDAYMIAIDDQELDLLIVFSENFLSYDGTNIKGSVTVYSNPNSSDSNYINSLFMSYLNTYGSTLSFDLYGDTSYFDYDLSSTPIDMNSITGSIISSMLPMLVIMFLFSGALSIGPESISGEKERNTISTILITPVKRSEIALGKILGLSVLSLLSAISSFIGIIFSLPKLLSLEGSSVAIYSISEYAMILLILFSTVFVIVGMVSIVSAYAKSVKEAATLIMPLYIITILVSITSLFNDSISQNCFMYLLPIYNSVQTLSAILRFDSNIYIYMLITIFANLMYLAIFVYILNKMFNSEKIMFSK